MSNDQYKGLKGDDIIGPGVAPDRPLEAMTLAELQARLGSAMEAVEIMRRLICHPSAIEHNRMVMERAESAIEAAKGGQ